MELLAVHAAAGRQVKVITDQDTPGYGTLADAPGIQIAADQIHMDTWFIQTDETMIAGINLPAETLQFTCPLIELDATIPGGLAERLQVLFEELWQTTPYTYTSSESDRQTTGEHATSARSSRAGRGSVAQTLARANRLTSTAWAPRVDVVAVDTEGSRPACRQAARSNRLPPTLPIPICGIVTGIV